MDQLVREIAPAAAHVLWSGLEPVPSGQSPPGMDSLSIGQTDIIIIIIMAARITGRIMVVGMTMEEVMAIIMAWRHRVLVRSLMVV